MAEDTVTFTPKKFSCKFGHKLGSTISDLFEFRVLSVNTSNPSPNKKQNHTLNGIEGSYGHVVLEFKSHGKLVLATATFSDLAESKVCPEKLWASIEKRKGNVYVS